MLYYVILYSQYLLTNIGSVNGQPPRDEQPVGGQSVGHACKNGERYDRERNKKERKEERREGRKNDKWVTSGVKGGLEVRVLAMPVQIER